MPSKDILTGQQQALGSLMETEKLDKSRTIFIYNTTLY